MSDQNKITTTEGPSGQTASDKDKSLPATATSERVLYPKLPVSEQPKETVASEEDEQTPELINANKLSEKQQKKWERRMRFFLCCVRNKDNKQSFREVAQIFAEFFTGLNVSLSDTVTAFSRLSKNQQAQRQWILENSSKNTLGVEQFLSGVAITEDTKFFDITRPEENRILNDLIYYSEYSLATFGYSLQAINYPCSICCIFPYLNKSLCCCNSSTRKTRQQIHDDDQREKDANLKPVELTIKCDAGNSKDRKMENDGNKCDEAQTRIESHFSQRSQSDEDLPIVLEDDCFGLNEAAVGQRLAEYNCEIIYITYRSEVHKTPFLVAADHSRRTIVVAIRGSKRLCDAVTDFHYNIDKIPLENCPDDWLCHRGITSASVYVKTTLIQERILERAFSCRPDLGSHNYRLVLCGHSLGAGAAAILGVLMRPLYPSLRAYLYSPPGGILSLPVVEYTKEFAISITLGYDIIARCGLAQLERLRYHALISLKMAQKSPKGVMARLCPFICFARNQVDEYNPEQLIDFLYDTNEAPIDYNDTQIPFQAQPQMLFIPGRIIHVVKNSSFEPSTRRHWTGPAYQAIWTENESYDRILLEDGWCADHMPWNLTAAMNMLRSKSLPGRFSSMRSTLSSSSKEVSS